MSRASQRQDEREFQKSCELLRNALNEKNRAEFDAMDEDMKRILIEEAFKDGIITYDAPYARAVGRPLPR